MSETKESSQVIQQRREKMDQLREMGVPLYPNSFRPCHRIRDILPLDKEITADSHEPHPFTYIIAGRIVGLRKFGKASFLHIQDETGRLQVYVQRDRVGADSHDACKKWDIGDIAGFTGKVFKTRTGELTLQAEKITLITKSSRPLPEKFHGLTDVEMRYRQRYVDLIVNPDVRDTFKKRVVIIRLIRDFLNNRGFIEVETPMMQQIPGGATARPFKTHHNALGIDLFLRVAPELYLKRLLVGGFEKVFELNRNFRNEGLSTRHNPEFTMLEFYQAYAGYQDLMDLTEELVSGLAAEICGSMEITYQGQTVDLSPPWQRLTMDQALVEVGGVDAETMDDPAALFALCRQQKIVLPETAGPGKAKNELFEALVEEKLVNPTFITEYPTEISPLARRKSDNPEVTERFELFITGREMANGFNELNDPVDQGKRFARQIAERGDDVEIHPEMDHDFVRALEYGMPPAAGEGIGIDRLVMLLTDAPSIRDVILFPHLKPEAR